jgi:hypothetical protein
MVSITLVPKLDLWNYTASVYARQKKNENNNFYFCFSEFGARGHSEQLWNEINPDPLG